MIEILILLGAALLLAWAIKNKKIPNIFAQKSASTASQQPTVAEVKPVNPPAQAAAQEVVEPVVKSVEPTISEPAPQIEVVSAAPVAAEPVSPVAAVAEPIKAPEVAVQSSDAIAAEQTKNTELSNPYPTDSVLRRHYETLHQTAAVKNETAITATASSPQAVAPAVTGSKQAIPQDSTLLRHFLTQLRSEIEAQLPPKPSDSALIRHHETLVQAKLQQRLAEF